MLLNTNFYLDINVANDIAIDFAKCALPGKVMQGFCAVQLMKLGVTQWN